MITIETNPANWDTSIITAHGVMHHDRPLSPSVTRMAAADMQPDMLAVWQGCVAVLQGEGAGSKDCVHIVCTMTTTVMTDDDDAEDPNPIVRLACTWLHNDHTTSTTEHDLPGDAAIALYTYLMTPSIYNR